MIGRLSTRLVFIDCNYVYQIFEFLVTTKNKHREKYSLKQNPKLRVNYGTLIWFKLIKLFSNVANDFSEYDFRIRIWSPVTCLFKDV